MFYINSNCELFNNILHNIMNNKQKKIISTPTDPYRYYGNEDFEHDLGYIQEYYSRDVSTKIILYQIDTVKTKVNQLYGEAKAYDKKILPPIELTAMIEIGDINSKNLTSIGIVDETYDSFKFSVFINELNEKNVSIKRGDFILYNDGTVSNFFEINKVSNILSKNTIGGLKPYFFSCEAILQTNNVLPKELKIV